MAPWLIYSTYFFAVGLIAASLLLATRHAQPRPWWRAAWVLLALATGLFVVAVSEPKPLLSDFCKAYYPAGQLILTDSADLYRKVQPGEVQEAPGFVNIPIVALLFAPLSLFGYRVAMTAITLLGIMAIYAAYRGLVKLTGISGSRRYALMALLLINGPMWNSLKEGNLSHFVLPVLVGALLCLQSKRDFLAGVCLAVAGLIKLPLFLLAVYFGLRGRKRVVVGFSACLGLCVGASVLLFGWGLHEVWWREAIAHYSGKSLTGFNVQSLNGFLARCLTDGSLTNWLPANVDWRFSIVLKALAAGLAAAVAAVFWRAPASLEQPREVFTEFSIVLCLALVVSPISWTHYYLYLLIPFGLFLGHRLSVPDGLPWRAAMAASLLLVSPPVLLVADAGDWSRAATSHYLFGALLLMATLLGGRLASAARSRKLSAAREETRAVILAFPKFGIARQTKAA